MYPYLLVLSNKFQNYVEGPHTSTETATIYLKTLFENCGLHVCEAFVTNADVTNNVFFAVSGLVWGMESLYFPFVYMKLDSSA